MTSLSIDVMVEVQEEFPEMEDGAGCVEIWERLSDERRTSEE